MYFFKMVSIKQMSIVFDNQFISNPRLICNASTNTASFKIDEENGQERK